MKRIHMLVSGRVQMVGYRYFLSAKAKALGITGHAKNLEDGKVEVMAEGDPDKLAIFLEVCRKGPFLARVESIEVSELNGITEFTNFNIL